MNMKNKTIKFWAKVLSVALMVSMASGYICSPVVVSAEQVIAEETTLEETTTPGETTTVDPDAYTLTAHRGYSGYAPANSMPAFEKAIAAGFTNIELDVRRCKPDAKGDVKWVLSHDDSLKNTMGVNLKVSELTYSQILQYSYTKGNGIEAYKNLKIVTLDEIIELIKKSKAEGLNVSWQIEIKDTDFEDYTDHFEEELVKPVVEADVQDCVTFSSFNSAYLKKIKSIDSSLRTWYLSTILDQSAINKAHNCEAEGISFKGTVNSTTDESIEAALAEGFKLGAYTINSPVIMGAFYQKGIRSFATDVVSPMEVHKDILNGTYNIKAFTITLSKDSYTYDGTKKLPKAKVLYKNEELVEGVNYELSYSDNKNPGTASVYISGINNCKDEQKLTFKINMPKVTGFKIASAKTTYINLSWTKVNNVSGYIVYRYNYTTKKYEEIKTITNPETVTYKVKNLQSATKYRYRVKTYLNIDGKTYESDACSGKTTYTRPAKAQIKSLKRYSGYKRLKIKWKAVPRCTGYTVKIATDKKMKKVVGTYTVKGSNKLQLKIKKLSKNKKYYVKVRAYLKVGKNTYNGVYSTVKKSKGKK